MELEHQIQGGPSVVHGIVGRDLLHAIGGPSGGKRRRRAALPSLALEEAVPHPLLHLVDDPRPHLLTIPEVRHWLGSRRERKELIVRWASRREAMAARVREGSAAAEEEERRLAARAACSRVATRDVNGVGVSEGAVTTPLG